MRAGPGAATVDPLPDQLIGMPAEAARHFVDTARAVADPHADNATVLVADIRP